jgi:Ca2+-binding RTX toxin-like protein
LIGGQLGDTLKGGAGEDTASYETAASAVTVTLGGSGTGDAQDDVFELIENLTGSGGDDELTGDPDNVLTGAAGADKLPARTAQAVILRITLRLPPRWLSISRPM